MPKVALLLALLLGGCETVRAVDTYCARFPRMDLSDPALLHLNRHNKQAVIVGEKQFVSDCLNKGP